MRSKMVFVVAVGILVAGLAWFIPRYGGHEVDNRKWVKQMAMLTEPTSVRPTATKEVVKNPIASPENTPVPTIAQGTKVKLNVATVDQLDTLPGIGPSKAALIIAYREQHGAFQTVEELQLVKGIGEKTFAKLAPLLELD